MKVLINGGGLAGNALTFWLSKLGHDVTVLEHFETLRATGLQIDLRGHGIEVLKHMDLEAAFRAKSVPEQGWQLVDSSGKRRAFFPANKSGNGHQGLTSEFEIMRGDLVSLMYEASRDRAKYVFGTSVESLEQDQNSVDVRFSDGRADKFDLVVGADGQWSRIRRLMLGSDTTDGFYPLEGSYIGYFTTPRPAEDGEEYMATWYTAPAKRGMMIRRHSPDEIQVYLACQTKSKQIKEIRRGNVVEEKAALIEIFQGAGWQADEILKSLKEADDFYLERLGLVKIPSWSNGRVALVGDAAYCPSANTGMGTTASIVGAYVLAGEIGKHCRRPKPGANVSEDNDVEDALRTALQSYETKFRPFMEQVQKGVLEDTGSMPSSSFGVAVFNLFAGLASFLRLNIAEWYLKENVKNWDLPEYEEML